MTYFNPDNKGASGPGWLRRVQLLASHLEEVVIRERLHFDASRLPRHPINPTYSDVAYYWATIVVSKFDNYSNAVQAIRKYVIGEHLKRFATR